MSDSDSTNPVSEQSLERPFLALVSKLVVGEKPCPVRFMYRTVPANLKDTGWRMYSGYEDPEFLSDPQNMQPYPLETLVKMDASLEELIKSKPGSVWERVPGNTWEAVEDYEIPSEEVETQVSTTSDDFDNTNA